MKEHSNGTGEVKYSKYNELELFSMILSDILVSFAVPFLVRTYMQEDTDMVFRDGEWVERER